MSKYEEIINKKAKIAVVGLGYVGMPIAVAFAKKVDVIGFDLNKMKIDQYEKGNDPTNEVGGDIMSQTTVEFTSEEERLSEASFYIVAVPTPINQDKTPNLDPVINASKIVGRNLKRGAIVVYESTVYPGVTEDICIPILEENSGLLCGIDFKVGYSPERINPGDKVHRLENIKKIVSGSDKYAIEQISNVYELIIDAGVYKAPTIKTAEAAKVVENSQRDINIAFMNELAMVFDRMGIDTEEVIQAMNTKWNALRFQPGLVGGHCIGVDPYYFVYEAEKLGYHSQIITAGRKINDGMGSFIADAIIRELVLADRVVKKAKVAILGITFKENCPDIRNSKVIDIVKRLNEYGIKPIIVDPHADTAEVQKVYGINLSSTAELNECDCVVFAVAHESFKKYATEEIEHMYKENSNQEKVLIDVKSTLDKLYFKERGYRYWNL